MTLHDKTVLVTGAAGFVGSHLCERLLGTVEDLRAFIRYTSRGDRGLLNRLDGDQLNELDLIQGDLGDQDALRQAMEGVDVVFHLGAIVSIPYSYEHPQEVIETNVMGTTGALLAARNQDLDRFVHTSTSEVYGSAQYVPIDEDHPLQGQSPYSASKIGADKIAESFRDVYDVPVVTLRPFNMYGPRQSGRAVIPTIIKQALFSDTVNLGSLYPTRDFTFVKDTVEVYCELADAPGVEGEVYNAGTGEEIAIGDLADLILELTGSDAEVVTEEERKRPEDSEVDRLMADSEKLKNAVDWSPRSLREGLKRTIDWVRNNKAFYDVEQYSI